jgi:hypothetical protein
LVSERIFRCPHDPALQCFFVIRMQFTTPMRRLADAYFGCAFNEPSPILAGDSIVLVADQIRGYYIAAFDRRNGEMH